MTMTPDQLKQAIMALYGMLDDMVDELEAAVDQTSDLFMSDYLDYVVDDSALLHRDPERKYDPVKAHAYYMRTRKLKGRKPKDHSKTAPRSPERTARNNRIDNLFDNLTKLPQREAELVSNILENHLRAMFSFGKTVAKTQVKVASTVGRTGKKVVENSPGGRAVSELKKRLRNE